VLLDGSEVVVTGDKKMKPAKDCFCVLLADDHVLIPDLENREGKAALQPFNCDNSR